MNNLAKRVLIIEDNEDDYLIVRDLLADIASQKFEVEWVETVDAARDALNSGSYDVSLVDHRLMGRSGLALIEEQVVGDPAFILLTGNEDHELDIAATKAGAMDYLLKGHITAPILERSIRYAIERARHAAALQAALGQSRLLTTAVSNLTDGMVITDPRQPDNPIVFANAAFCAMTGYALEEVLGRNCRFLQGADTDPLTVRQIRAAIEEKRAFSGVILNYRQDGTPFWNGLKITPVFDGEGQVLNYVGLQSDVTARRQSELALHESEARKAAILDAALDGILTIDHQNTVVEFNPAAERIFGIAGAEVVGRAINDLFLDPVLRVGEQMELTGRRADGSFFPAEVAVTRIKVEGKPLFTGYVRDITERKRAQESLRQSESNLRAAQQVAHMGSWELELTEVDNLDKNSLRWSDEIFRIFGYEPGQIEVSITSFFGAVHPDDRQSVRAAMEKALKNDQPFSIDHRIIWPDGTERILHGQGEIIRDRVSGAALKVVGTGQDITESKHTEAAMARLAAIVEFSTDAIIGKALDDTIISWNAAAETLYGYTVQEAIGRSVTELLSPHRRSEPNQLMLDIAQGKRIENFETVRVHKNGRHLDVSLTVSPIRNEAGEIIGCSAISRDISDRKRAEKALRESEARGRAVIQNALDCIITINHEGRVVEFNPAAEVTFGYTRAEALGQDMCDLVVPPALRDKHKKGFARYLATGKESILNRRVEMPALHKDGSEIIVELTATVMAHSDPPQFIAYLRDITEKKRSEMSLRESEERFQSIVASVPGVVYQYVFHPDGSFELPFVNEGCRELFEMEKEEFQSHPRLMSDLIHPDDRAESDRLAIECARALTPWRWEGRLKLPSGKINWVQGVASPKRLPDGGTLWNGLLVDISARKAAEEERDRFFTMSLDMLVVAGLDGYFKRLNPAFSQTLGYSEAELLDRSFMDFVHAEDLAATQKTVEDLSAGNTVVGFENRYLAKDGDYRWLEWKAAVAENVIYAVARDITARKVAEAALLQSNDELEERVAARTNELEQTNVNLEFQIAERQEAEAKTRARARQQEAVALLGQRALSNLDLGTLLQGALALSAAVLDVDYGALVEWLPGTRQVQVQASVGRPSHLLHSYDAVPWGSMTDYILRSSAPVIMDNSDTETRFDISPSMRERNIKSMVAIKIEIGDQLPSAPPYGVLAVASPKERAFSHDDVNFLQSITNILATAIGRNRVESEIRQLNAQLSKTNEQLRIENIERQMALGTLREATVGLERAREEAEQSRESAEAANAAKSEFLSRMSHELRTPLNAILGFGQILDRQELTSLQREGVGYILKGGRHLLALINEVLDIARVEAGHVELSLEPVDVGEIVSDSCALVHPLIAERGIELVNHLPQAPLFYMMADRQRLKQVLINLLSNAIKYNREAGKVAVSVQLTAGGKMQLRISDSGMGLTPADIKKLFTPFERLGAADSTVEGTGLGLVLSQRLVTSMGGILSVESVPGEGSTFWIELPQAESPLQALAQSKEMPAPAPFPHEKRTYTALYIEDNLSNIRLLEAVIATRPEINLLTAMEGASGLDLARQHHPDVILLDLHMPGLSGSEILGQLQQSQSTRAIPVVVVSADATPQQIEKLLGAGATAYLTKPLDVPMLLSTLDGIFHAAEVNVDSPDQQSSE